MLSGDMKYTANKKRKYCFEYKALKGCSVCGEKDPIVLEFHHRQGEQKHKNLLTYSSSHRSFADMSWEVMLDEIKKCDVVCANCHRRISFNEIKEKIQRKAQEDTEQQLILFATK